MYEFCDTVPDGKPTVISAGNISSWAIRVEWSPPNRNTIHGEFLGYRIKYRKHGPTLGIEREITLRDPDLRVSSSAPQHSLLNGKQIACMEIAIQYIHFNARTDTSQYLAHTQRNVCCLEMCPNLLSHLCDPVVYLKTVGAVHGVHDITAGVQPGR